MSRFSIPLGIIGAKVLTVQKNNTFLKKKQQIATKYESCEIRLYHANQYLKLNAEKQNFCRNNKQTFCKMHVG